MPASPIPARTRAKASIAPAADEAKNAAALTLAPRRRRKQARPRELIDAALELFVSKGFTATRIEEVAQHAGVSKGTLYLYFPSKQDLLQAVIREHVSTRISAGAVEIGQFQGNSADLLGAIVQRWCDDVYDSPVSGVFKVVITEARNFPDIADFWQREVRLPGEKLLAQVLRRGVERGEFHALDVPSAVHSLALPMVMLCVHKHTLGASDLPQPLPLDGRAFMRAHLQLLLNGMRAAPTAHPGETLT